MAKARRTAVRRTPRRAKLAPEYSYIDQNLRKECLDFAIRGHAAAPGADVVKTAQEIYDFMMAKSLIGISNLAPEPMAALYTQEPEEVPEPDGTQRPSRFEQTHAL